MTPHRPTAPSAMTAAVFRADLHYERVVAGAHHVGQRDV